MRRWNGWGDDGVVTRIPGSAITHLEGLIGPAGPTPDATLADVLATIHQGTLPAHSLVSVDAEDRVRHAPRREPCWKSSANRTGLHWRSGPTK